MPHLITLEHHDWDGSSINPVCVVMSREKSRDTVTAIELAIEQIANLKLAAGDISDAQSWSGFANNAAKDRFNAQQKVAREKLSAEINAIYEGVKSEIGVEVHSGQLDDPFYSVCANEIAVV